MSGPRRDHGVPPTWRALLTTLRRPALIVTELAALATGSAVAVLVPQEPDGAEVARFAADWPALAAAFRALGLHSATTSPWFLAIAALALASLLAVQLEQWGRLRRTFLSDPAPEAFARAPFRVALPLDQARVPPEPVLERRGRAGMLGSPLFHLGLVLMVVAGLVRGLYSSEAVARVYEGQQLGAAPGAFDRERGGPLSTPFTLATPLRLERVEVAKYASGSIRQVEAVLARDGGGPPVRLAINAPLDLPGWRTLYLLNAHGVSLAVAERGPDGEHAHVVPLEDASGTWRGGFRTGSGLEARFRAGPSADLPAALELRVVRGGVLLALSEVPVGSGLTVAPGTSLEVVGVGRWVELKGSRDPSVPLFMVGLVTALVGATLMFAVVTVDTGVFVERGLLVVALRPMRFPPLYAERFERLCKEWRA